VSYLSKAQQAFLQINKPKIAKEFAEKTTKADYKNLPKRVRKKAKKKCVG